MESPAEIPLHVTTTHVIRSNPSFRRLLTAVAVSSLGESLMQVAALVTIFVATHDPRFVALAFVAQALGAVLIGTVLGGPMEKLPQRDLVVSLGLLGVGIVVGTVLPVASEFWWLIIPILFCLACINAIVLPAQQSAISKLVPSGQIGKANGIVAATTMLMGAIGYALAGGLLLVFLLPKSLFVAAALIFVVEAFLLFGIPSLGVAAKVRQTSLTGALVRTWAVSVARPHLVIGALAAFLIPISFPALVVLAFEMSSPGRGGQLYSAFEVVLSVGVLAGSIMVSRFRAVGTLRNVGGGLFIIGGFCLGISLIVALGMPTSVALMLLSAALFLASLGNPVHSVANQIALLEATDPSNRDTFMTIRNALVQTAAIAGVAVGGIITALYGAGVAYSVLGAGLVLLSIYAFGASPRPIKTGGPLSS